MPTTVKDLSYSPRFCVSGVTITEQYVSGKLTPVKMDVYFIILTAVHFLKLNHGIYVFTT